MISKTKTNRQDISPKTQAWIENHGIIWFVWILTIIIGLRSYGEALKSGVLKGNDDYLRLVQIRDWLSGQNWLDLYQYRLNPQDPTLMHWSRFSDLLIGLPIKALTPILGQESAELIVLIGYPALLLLMFFYLIAHLTKQFTNHNMAVMASSFMAVLSYSVLSQFSAGRIDHHGLQIVVAVLCLIAILRSAHDPRQTWLAGMFCGLSLYIGIESAPYIAAACISTALIWVFNESNAEQRLRGFGISMAVTTLLLFGINTPISSWLTPHCDALSVVYTQLTLGVALILWAVSFTSKTVQSPLSRLAVLAMGAVIVLGGIVLLYPQCLQGPYANIDPLLRQVWLNNVAEAKPFHQMLIGDPVTGSSMIALPILACIGAWVYHVKTKPSANKAVRPFTHGPSLSLAPRSIFNFMGLCLLAGLVQTRLMMFATVFAIPLAAYLLITALEASNSFESVIKKQMGRILSVIILSPIAAPIAASIAASMALSTVLPQTSKLQPTNTTTQNGQAKLGKANCLSGQNFHAFKRLESGTALTQIDLGAPVLSQTTKLGVMSAPYHRNTDGILAAITVFTGTETQARDTIVKTKANYVIACTSNNEANLYLKISPEGLMAQFKKGEIPVWLETMDLGQSKNLLILKVNTPDP